MPKNKECLSISSYSNNWIFYAWNLWCCVESDFTLNVFVLFLPDSWGKMNPQTLLVNCILEGFWIFQGVLIIAARLLDVWLEISELLGILFSLPSNLSCIEESSICLHCKIDNQCILMIKESCTIHVTEISMGSQGTFTRGCSFLVDHGSANGAGSQRLHSPDMKYGCTHGIIF